MANKLKDLKITSVDLCPQGANQEAYIKFFKSEEEGGEKVEKKRGLMDLIKKAFGLDNDEEAIQVKNDLIQEIKEEEEVKDKHPEKETKETKEKDEGVDKMSTINLNELTEEQRKKIQAIINGTVGKEDKPEGVPEKEEVEKEDNSEIKKEYENIQKELVDVKKELRITKMAKEFTKYETLGKNSEEIAKQYIELENVSEDIAKSFVETLDDALKIQEESGIFKTAGKDGHSEIVEKNMTTLEEKAAEIQKRDNCSKAQAVVKAYDENPELYEALIENK